MDNLDLLKEKWQNMEQELPKLSYSDIYQMLLKKSSSILKWIVIISICEIAFWTLLSLFVPESSKQFYSDMGVQNFIKWVNIINYFVVAIFIYIFYKNHKKIKATQSVKTLMGNILRARKTVHYFVFYNIGLATLLVFGLNTYYYFHTEKLNSVLKQDELYSAYPAETFIGANIFAGFLVLVFLVLFYWVAYGILLKRLKRNYNELRKIET